MMFLPERMIRMDVLALREDTERLTRVLVREGSFHIVTHAAGVTAAADAPPLYSEKTAQEIERLTTLADALLQRLDWRERQTSAGPVDPFFAERTEEIVREGADALQALQEAVDGHLEAIREARNAIQELDTLAEEMHLLGAHGLSFKALSEFRHLHVVCGTLDLPQSRRLAELLSGKDHVIDFRVMHDQRVAFLLLGDPTTAAEFDAAIKESGGHVQPPVARAAGTIEDELEAVELDLWQYRDRLAELNGNYARQRPEWLATLARWRARLRVHRVFVQAATQFATDGTITQFSGFVRKSRCAALLRRLEAEAQGCYHVSLVAADDDDSGLTPPTHLQNIRMFRPFEMFVKTYALPGYNDIDPTPLVAVSFLLMFGLMFGDVGHGLVLAALGACLAFLPYRIFLPARDLGRILLMAGLAGTICGFLFGSVFGVEDDAVLPALWLRPSESENLTPFLVAALCIGVGMQTAGIIFSIIQNVRRRDYRHALIGQWSAASLVLFWALLTVLGLRLTGHTIAMPTGVLLLLLALPLLLISGGQLFFMLRARQRPSSSGGHAGESEAEGELATILFEPVEIMMNLFTNSVSFLRVAAFGLAHAALTTAAFVVSNMIDMPGATMLSLAMEHLLIIVMEGMIVTIQCLRLEYYEFFSKFFVGNGIAYTPLAIPSDHHAD